MRQVKVEKIAAANVQYDLAKARKACRCPVLFELAPSFLALAQVEDLADVRVGVNLPGTDLERPNWRRRLAAPLAELMASEAGQAILRAMRAGRAG